MRAKVLICNHLKETCGVWQYGRSIYESLRKSGEFDIFYVGSEDVVGYGIAIDEYEPDIVLYNWHPYTMPWCGDEFTALYPQVIHSAIWHDPVHVPPASMKVLISQDPNEEERVTPERTIYRSLRLVRMYSDLSHEKHDPPVIGSFGLLAGHKRFASIVNRVLDEFDRAIIRFNIPSGHFASRMPEIIGHGVDLQRLVSKSSVELQISHDFFSTPALVHWLAQNDLNMFIYDEQAGHGNSSATDHALSARRPIAINKSHLFRHLWDVSPSICIGETSLKQIIANGTEPLKPLYDKWSEANFVRNYERIFNRMLNV